MSEKDGSKNYLDSINSIFSGLDTDGIENLILTEDLLDCIRTNMNLILSGSNGDGNCVVKAFEELAVRERRILEPDSLEDVLAKYAKLAEEAKERGLDEAATYLSGVRLAHINIAGEVGDFDLVLRNLGKGSEAEIKLGINRSVQRRRGRRN